MRTLDSYQTTPFQLDVVRLRERFEECAPLHRISLHRIADILRLDVTKHANESTCLREILALCQMLWLHSIGCIRSGVFLCVRPAAHVSNR